jgi:hypothetical protein
VTEPEFSHVFLYTLLPQPRVPEAPEPVPAQSVLIQPQLVENRIEPIVREIAIEVRSVLVCVEDKSGFRPEAWNEVLTDPTAETFLRLVDAGRGHA